MTEFEKKLLQDLQNGKTMDEITAEFAKHLSAAEAEHKALEEKKAAAAKAEEEAKAKARAEIEKTGTAIAELANRMLNGELTGKDVEWVVQSYLEQENCDFDVYMKNMVDKIFDEIGNAFHTQAHKRNCDCECKSDEDVIRSFVARIM